MTDQTATTPKSRWWTYAGTRILIGAVAAGVLACAGVQVTSWLISDQRTKTISLQGDPPPAPPVAVVEPAVTPTYSPPTTPVTPQAAPPATAAVTKPAAPPHSVTTQPKPPAVPQVARETATASSALQYVRTNLPGLPPADQSLLTVILLGSAPSEWSLGVQKIDQGGQYTLDSILQNLPGDIQQAMQDQQLSADMVQPVVQTMVAMIQQSTADSVMAARLEAQVQSSGEISSCALGGGGVITWTNGSYAGCVG